MAMDRATERTMQLVHLPAEMLKKILVKVDRSAAKNCRLVSKMWKSIMDKKYENWAIILDDECSYLEFWLSLPIKSVKIVQFTKPLDFSPTGRILKHPENLEKIIMDVPPDFDMNDPTTHYENQLPEANPDHLKELLSCPNLKEISLVLRSLMLEAEIVNPDSQDFKHLEKLKIHVILEGCNYSKVNDFLKTCFLNRPNQLFRLSSLTLTFDGEENVLSHCSFHVISTIRRANFEGVKYFELRFKSDPANRYDGYMNIRDIEGLNRIAYYDRVNPYSSVETFKVTLLRHSQMTYFPNLFMTLQTNLVNLDFDKDTFIGAVPLSLTASKNFTTLVSVRIQTLLIARSPEPFFDLAVFENCGSLRYLELGTVKISSSSEEDYLAEIRNLAKLPPNLAKLALNAFLISNEELVKFGQIVPCKTFEEFELKGCGRTGLHGVKEKALKSFLDIPSLKRLCVLEGSLNVSKGLESKDFRQFLKHFGCDGPNYFKGFGCQRNESGHWEYEKPSKVLFPTGL